MATDFCEDAFQPDFAKKTTETDQSSNAFQSFRINATASKLFGQILRLIYFSEN